MNRFLRPLVAPLAFAAALAAAPISAQTLSAADQTALNERVARFSDDFANGDMVAVSGVVPPKVMETMAAQFGLDPADLVAAMGEAMNEAMKAVEINSYTMDMDNARTAVTTAGRTYVLIPTATEMVVNGTTKVAATSETLAFADDGIWYLVRIDDAQQVQFLTQAYPEFKGVDFPAGTVKILEE